MNDLFNDDNLTGEVKLFEHKGKTFKLCQEGIYNYWVVRHNSNNAKVVGCDGAYTTSREAEKAVLNLPDSRFEKETRKTVLTPKGSKEQD